jgi:hypothetical protein
MVKINEGRRSGTPDGNSGPTIKFAETFHFYAILFLQIVGSKRDISDELVHFMF